MGAPECQSIANRVLCFCSQAARKAKKRVIFYIYILYIYMGSSGHAFPTGQGQSEYLEQLLVTWQELDVLLCQLGSVWKYKAPNQNEKSHWYPLMIVEIGNPPLESSESSRRVGKNKMMQAQIARM